MSLYLKWQQPHGAIVCRNIKTLFNFEPPTTDSEIREHRSSSCESSVDPQDHRRRMKPLSNVLLMISPRWCGSFSIHWSPRHHEEIAKPKRLKTGRRWRSGSLRNEFKINLLEAFEHIDASFRAHVHGLWGILCYVGYLLPHPARGGLSERHTWLPSFIPSVCDCCGSLGYRRAFHSG